MTPDEIMAHLRQIGLPHMAEEVQALVKRADGAGQGRDGVTDAPHDAVLRLLDAITYSDRGGRYVSFREDADVTPYIEDEVRALSARLEAAEALAEAVRGQVVGEVLGILRSRLHEDGALDEAPHETDDLLARIAALTSPP